MADKKQKNPSLITPPLMLKWPRLGAPDTKFNKNGEYSTKALGDPNDAKVQAFLKKLDKAVDDAVVAMKEQHPKFKKSMIRVPAYNNDVDKEGEETGKVEFNFKMPAKVVAGPKSKNPGAVYEFRPALFKANGDPLPLSTRVGGGTIAQVSFEFWPYFSATDKKAGITRRLTAIRIIKLVEWSSDRDASDYGFDLEDEFAESEDADTSASTDATDDSDDETETGNAGDF
jgi:hypothetical protein